MRLSADETGNTHLLADETQKQITFGKRDTAKTHLLGNKVWENAPVEQ